MYIYIYTHTIRMYNEDLSKKQTERDNDFSLENMSFKH